MINNTTIQHRPIKELMSIVKQGPLRKLDDEGLIDEGRLIKVVKYCNDRLGILIREVKQRVIAVENFEGTLPLDFEKLYFTCALSCTNSTMINHRNPFNNNFDRDVIYEADIDRDSFGGTPNYNVTINRISSVEVKAFTNYIHLNLTPSSLPLCHLDCPNNRRPGRYEIDIHDGKVTTPFKTGELYMMYLGMMKDEEGSILFPFHPIITPWYEWMVIEAVLIDAIFNSDGNYGELLKTAQIEKAKAWLDAFNFTIEKEYGAYVRGQRQKELKFYNQYFKFFQ